MQLLEILTDVGVFTATLAEYEIVIVIGDAAPTQPLTPLEIFQRARNDALKGCAMYGWTPTDDRRYDTPCTFTIEQGARVLSTKLYTPTDTAIPGEPTATDQKPPFYKVYDFAFDGEYLGNVLHISGLGYRTTSTEYLLPISVGDKHACDSMKGAALAQQVQLWKETQGVPSTEYLVIIPDVPMSLTDARDYLVDYADETEPQTSVHGDGKAKAWSGWNEA